MVEITNNPRKKNSRVLQQDVDNCVHKMQEYVDTESVQTMAKFAEKTRFNEQWLDEISSGFDVEDKDALQRIEQLKCAYFNKIDLLEDKIDYMEKLYNELKEFQKEIEVKVKSNTNRS